MRKPVALSGTALALLLTAPGLTGVASAACNGVPGTTGAPLAQTDFTTPGDACYVVPAGVESIRATVVGGAGGAGLGFGGALSGGARGGFGAVVQARLDVVPGQEIALRVAQNGSRGDFFQGASGGGSSRLDGHIIAGGGGGGGGLPDAMFSSTAVGGIGGSAGPGGGSGGDGTGGGGGGRPGTFNAGGAGGTGGVNLPAASPGGAEFGGAPSFFPDFAVGHGGGGGHGAYGGGAGGSARGFDTPEAAGGGGGAGSTFIDPAVDGPSVSTDGTGTPLISITAGGVAALTALPASALTFATTQPQGTLSAPQTVVLTSTGGAALRIDAVTIAGANPDDYVISGDTCRRPLPAAGTCAVSVRFVPQATGPRTAQLAIDGNVATTTLALSGTGEALPKGDAGLPGPIGTGTPGLDGATGSGGPIGATGPKGTDGSTGPKGADGTNGRNGADASTTCLITTSRTTAGAESISSVLCTIETVAARKSGSRARLSRRGKVVATGVERQGQPLYLKLRKGVKLTAGTYRLTRTYRQAGRTVTENRTVRVKKAKATTAKR